MVPDENPDITEKFDIYFMEVPGDDASRGFLA